MTYETALQIGIDLIAPAVTIFVIWFSFRPWHTNHIGRAIWIHALGTAVVFNVEAIEPWTGEHWPGREPFTLAAVALWIVGWWYLVFALWLTRAEARRDRQRRRREHEQQP